MIKKLIFPLCLLLWGNLIQAQSFQFRYETAGGDSIRILSTAPAPNDGLWVLGNIANAFGSSSGNASDAIVMRIDAQGGLAWSREYDAGTFQGINTIIAAPNNGFAIAGTSTTDYFDGYVARGDSDGDLLWSTFLGDADGLQRGFELLATSDGGFLFAGHAAQLVDTEIYLAKLTADGALEWGRRYPISGLSSTAYDVKEHPAGGYLVCGIVGETFSNDAFLLRVLADGSPLFMASYDYQGRSNSGLSTLVLEDGGAVLLQGVSLGQNFTDPQAMILTRVDFNGEAVWSRMLQLDQGPVVVPFNGFNFALSGSVQNVERAPDGGFLLHAVTNLDGTEELQPTLIKVSGDGEVEWARALAGEDWLQYSIFGTQPLSVTSDGFFAAAYQDLYERQTFELIKIDAQAQEICLEPLQINFQDAVLERTVLSPAALEFNEQRPAPTTGLPLPFVLQPFTSSNLQINLGPDTVLCSGAQLLLDPEVGVDASYLWQDGSTDSTLLVTEAGLYSLTLTQGECVAEDSIQVGTLDSAIGLGPDTTLCAGDTLLLQPAAIFDGTYSWNTGQDTAALQVTAGGTYILDFTNECGTVSDTVVVNVATLPGAVTASGLVEACVGSEIVLSGSAPPGLSLGWADLAGELLESGSSLPLILSTDTTVLFFATDGCAVGVDTVEIVALQPPVATDSSLVDASCGEENGSISLSIAGGQPPYTFLWQGGSGVPFNTDEPTLDNLASGTYSLSVTDERGCEAAFTFEVEEEGAPQLSVSTSSPSCSGFSDGSIELSVTGGLMPFVYQWSREGLPLPDAGNALSGISAGTYGVTVTDAGGCSRTLDGIEVQTATPWSFDLELAGPLCPGEANGLIEIEALSGGQAPYQYQLDNGPQQEEGFFPELPSGAYSLYVQGALGCDTTLSLVLQPPSSFDPLLQASATDIEAGASVQLNLLGAEGAAQISWSAEPGLEFSCSDCPNPFVVPAVSTTIIATSTTDAGCVVSDTIVITVDQNKDVYIPTAFSPNEDGRNDVFQIFPGRGLARVLKMEIYDRWGGLLYESEAASPSWDGTANGAPLNVGAYAYRIEVEWVDGRQGQFAGEVYLLR